MHFGYAWLESQRSPKLRYRLAELALFLECQAEAVLGVGIIRLEGNRAFVLRNRLMQFALSMQSNAEVS